MSLDSLAPKIQQRDERAFHELYEKMRRPVFSLCLGIVQKHHVAEDLTQETFITVWNETHCFSGRGYKTWILTIAKNKSINELKKGQRVIETDYTTYEPDAQAFNEAANTDLGLALEAALNCLEIIDRELVLLRNAGLKMKEAAALLGIPRGTASWRYANAIQKLKNHMEGKQ